MRSYFLARSVRPLSFAVGMLVGLFGSASAMSATALSHGPDPLFHDGLEGLTAGPFNNSDASRFLAQATFGPTDADIQTLRSRGYVNWINDQFAATPTYQLNYLNWIEQSLGEEAGEENRQEAWFLGAMGGPDPQNNMLIHSDQLRQRVAFALSEIFVVSQENSNLYSYPRGLAYFYDILARDAFGNYRTLLQDVTLSPAMGVYLNMMGNRRADSTQNLHPDENYGREINQLFSIGLVELNIDGTQKLSGGQPIPTYTQSTVTAFAHVFTSWNWLHCNAGQTYDAFSYCFPPYGDYPSDFETPMVPYETIGSPTQNSIDYHDDGTHPDDLVTKQLFDYGQADHGIVPVGQSATADLTFALDNIFNHPNVGPFIGKQLIQRLVTSNPSPAYVQRIATIFNNNGSGVRGDLKAVVKAILLDPEARYGQWTNPDTFGKLREPLLVLTHFWRAMHALHYCGQNIVGTGGAPSQMYANQPYRYASYQTQYTIGLVSQASLDAATVFNFFKPGFIPPGEMTTKNLLGPELQLQTDSNIANSTNTIGGNIAYFDSNQTCDNDATGYIEYDQNEDSALAGTGTGGSSAGLVDAYSTRFMSGQMSPFMRQTLIAYLDTITNDNTGSDWRKWRVLGALYLIFTSPEYMVQK